MLELKNIVHYYNGLTGKVQSLHAINLEIGQGEIIGLFGENGAGKTTLEKCILGLLNCSGEILLDGKAVTKRDMERFAFATCEHSFFPNLTPAQHEEFYKMYFDNKYENKYVSNYMFYSQDAVASVNSRLERYNSIVNYIKESIYGTN